MTYKDIIFIHHARDINRYDDKINDLSTKVSELVILNESIEYGSNMIEDRNWEEDFNKYILFKKIYA